MKAKLKNMLNIKPIDYNSVAEMLKVLGHPVRLMLINELLEADKTVTELWQSVGLPQSLVSQHLAVLRHSGIIKNFRRGNLVYYTIVDKTAIEILKLIQKQKGENKNVS